MGGCKEEDFLEKLRPQLCRKIRAERKPCPDAETLSAVLEGTAPGPVREQVMEHLTHCAECAALETRLRAFDDVTMPESAEEWSQQQIRLDNWLDGFLRSERASRAKREGKPLRGTRHWESVSRYLSPAKLQWALGVSVALLLIIGSVLLVRLRHRPVSENQAALRQAMPQQQPVSPPAGEPLKAQPVKPAAGARTKATAPQGKHAATHTSSPEATAPSPPQDHSPPTLTAEARQAPPPRPEAGDTSKSTSVYPPYARYPVGPKAFTPNGRAVAITTMGMLRGGSVVVPSGQEASLGPGGRIIEIRDGTRGMTIECGFHPADRRIVTERNGQRLVSLGPNRGYVERAYLLGNGLRYYQRTYWVGEHAYARAYRGFYYRGVLYKKLVPTHYYHPTFYGWASNPWATPVYYSPAAWGWAGEPWFGFFGDFFTPYPVYTNASLWLTDYLIAANLQAAYQAQDEGVAAAAPAAASNSIPPPSGAAEASQQTPLRIEAKQAIADEVQRQLAAERAAAAPQQAAPTAEQVPDALNPAERVFVVSSSLDVAVPASGQECSLTAGDVVMRLSDTPGANQTVTASIQSTKKADCPTGQTVAIGVQDLQEMHNSFLERLDSGINALASDQGKGGLPSAPDCGTSQGEVPPPVPDMNVENMLRDQQKKATLIEAEVQQQVKTGQTSNELATTPPTTAPVPSRHAIGAGIPNVPGAGRAAAAASPQPAKRATNPPVLSVPRGRAVGSRPTMRTPANTARPAPSKQQSKPPAPAPPQPHP